MRTRTWTAALSAGLAMAGCSGHGQPTADSFRAGTCRQGASAALSLAGAAGQLAAGSKDSAQLRERLRHDQQTLRALLPTAAGVARGQLQQLVTDTGRLRLGLDSHSDSKADYQRVIDSERAFERSCTA